MDLILNGNISLHVPLVGISCLMDVESLVFHSKTQKQFYFYKNRFNSTSISFLFYERTYDDFTFLNALESLLQYGALDFDITLRRRKLKCAILTVPFPKEDIFVYLRDAINNVYPLDSVFLQFESRDVYHECDLHLEDLYKIGYGQKTESARWTTGLRPHICIVGFILCATIPNNLEDPLYDFIEFEFTLNFYLRITLNQTFESEISSRSRINRLVEKVLDELPISRSRKMECWDLWQVTKTLQVYESDLNTVHFQDWSCLWLLKSLSPLFDFFDSYKLNPKITASYRLSGSIPAPLPRSESVSQASC